MEWCYVWWPWLTSESVARVCQHQLSFLLIKIFWAYEQCCQWLLLDICGCSMISKIIIQDFEIVSNIIVWFQFCIVFTVRKNSNFVILCNIMTEMPCFAVTAIDSLTDECDSEERIQSAILRRIHDRGTHDSAERVFSARWISRLSNRRSRWMTIGWRSDDDIGAAGPGRQLVGPRRPISSPVILQISADVGIGGMTTEGRAPAGEPACSHVPLDVARDQVQLQRAEP